MESEAEENNQSISANYREIAKEDLLSVLESHKLWLKTSKAEGNQANLSETYLKGAAIVGASLENAIFKKAYLYGAYLKRSNLREADLSEANLRGANLRWSDLQGANLTAANLTRADIMKADLRKADLTNVRNLSCEQLDSAFIDKSTRLPDYIDISWISDTEYECKKVSLKQNRD